MDILLMFPGFILMCLVVLLYEYRIRLLRKQRNNVHFYLARDMNGELWLYIGKPFRGYISFRPSKYVLTKNLIRFGLKYEDYDYLKWEDEPVEVFLNLED